MPLFHQTLKDAMDAYHTGDIKKTKQILEAHQSSELVENKYIESSLYAIHVYLQNYITHLVLSIEGLSKEKPTPEDKKLIEMNMKKCQENINAFEDGIKKLLKREGALLE